MGAGEIGKREFTRDWRDCSVVESVHEFAFYWCPALWPKAAFKGKDISA